MATKQDAINRVLKIAEGEIGYLEKASNSQLDSKTANAGRNNYTKYWRDVKPEWNGSAWCAAFLSWVFMKAFGLEVAKTLLKHWPYVYCPNLGQLFTKHANPEVGDIVIFYRSGTFAHTGIVTKVQGDQFWTIEGNTSGGSTIISNGGSVCAKTYYNSNLPGTKFCRVDWEYAAKHMSDTPSSPTPPTSPSKTYNKTPKWTGVVTASSLNVRTAPGASNPTCSFSPLKNGEILEVCDDAANGWYYIKYKGKYGFVSGEYVKKQEAPVKPTSPDKPKVLNIMLLNEVKFPELLNAQKPSGAAVGLVQAILKAPVTNVWDNATINAIKAFKGSVGLSNSSPSVGKETWAKLMERVCAQTKIN